MLQLTFNPGLTLTGFRTTRPWELSSRKAHFISVFSCFYRSPPLLVIRHLSLSFISHKKIQTNQDIDVLY